MNEPSLACAARSRGLADYKRRSSFITDRVITRVTVSIDVRTKRAGGRGRLGATGISISEQSESAANREAVREHRKDDPTVKRLVESLETNMLFNEMTTSQKERLVGAMYLEEVRKGGVLIQQGEVASCCYIVKSGSFHVIKEKPGKGDELLAKLKTGTLFGELGLLYSTPRDCTVVAGQNSMVWVLSQRAFGMVLSTDARNAHMSAKDLLVTRSLFALAPDKLLSKLSLSFHPTTMMPGQSLEVHEEDEGLVYQLAEGRLNDATGSAFPIGTFFVVCSSAQREALELDTLEWLEICSPEASEFVQDRGSPRFAPRVAAPDHVRALSSRKSFYRTPDTPAAPETEREDADDVGPESSIASNLSLESPAALRNISQELRRESNERRGLDSANLQAAFVCSDSHGGGGYSFRTDATPVRAPPGAGGARPGSGGGARPGSGVRDKDSFRESSERNSNSDRGVRVSNSFHEPIGDAPLHAESKVKLQTITLVQFLRLAGSIRNIRNSWDNLRDISPLFAMLSGDMLKSVRECFDVQRSFEDGEAIVTQGEEGSEVFLLLEGEVSVSSTAGDTTVSCGNLRAGDLFGELAPFASRARSATVRARGPCVCAVMGAKSDVPAQQALPKPLLAHLEQLQPYYRHAEEVPRLDELKYLGDLGQGQFGTVLLMRDSRSDTPVVLKVMSRRGIAKAKQCEHILSEKQLQLELRHPFIARLRATFKDAEKLMLAFDFVAGGELYSLLSRRGSLGPELSRWVVGSVALCFEHIHSRHFIYRDLKPENLMIAADGHIVLVDFGMCKRLDPSEKTYTACGTVEYMAPELASYKGHGREVDWWTLGVLLYECMIGYTPFTNQGQLEQELVILRNIKDPSYEVHYDSGCSKACVHLIKGLLRRNPSTRYQGRHLRSHHWMKSLDLRALLRKELAPPFVPSLKDAFDMSNFDPEIEGEDGTALLSKEAEPYPGAADLEQMSQSGKRPWDIDF